MGRATAASSAFRTNPPHRITHFIPILVLIILLRSSLYASAHDQRRRDPLPENVETYMSAPEIIRHRGYPVEIHHVTTADHYVLEMHRIPHGRLQMSKERTVGRGRPVLLQHGVFASSAHWLIAPNNKSLAFRLADLGYDVWLGNTRGNVYSRQHLELDPNENEFWKYSWDELGMYDVPAFIDYILAVSKRPKLTYIGHSLGTAEFFIAMIQHPRLNAKIEKMIALAPISSKANLGNALRLIFPFLTPPVTRVWEKFQKHAIFDNNDFVRKVQRKRCEKTYGKATFCRNFYFKIVGSSPDSFDLTTLPVINSHLFEGTSIRVMAQFAQHYNQRREVFLRYDYGKKGNLERYGQVEPLVYDLSRVTSPVYIYYSDNDPISTTQDIYWLSGQLGNLKGYYRISDPLFNHWDFLWSTRVNEYLNDHLIAQLP